MTIFIIETTDEDGAPVETMVLSKTDPKVAKANVSPEGKSLGKPFLYGFWASTCGINRHSVTVVPIRLFWMKGEEILLAKIEVAYPGQEKYEWTKGIIGETVLLPTKVLQPKEPLYSHEILRYFNALNFLPENISEVIEEFRHQDEKQDEKGKSI